MGGFILVAYWRFGDAADEWIGVIDCKKLSKLHYACRW